MSASLLEPCHSGSRLYAKAIRNYNVRMITTDLITIDPDILGGTPVFKGTRVPVKALFDYLEADYTLVEFLECFPSVSREAACQVMGAITTGDYSVCIA